MTLLLLLLALLRPTFYTGSPTHSTTYLPTYLLYHPHKLMLFVPLHTNCTSLLPRCYHHLPSLLYTGTLYFHVFTGSHVSVYIRDGSLINRPSHTLSHPLTSYYSTVHSSTALSLVTHAISTTCLPTYTTIMYYFSQYIFHCLSPFLQDHPQC